MELDPGNTPQGKLPPFEVAKALAFEAAIVQMENAHTGKLCWELFGMDKAEEFRGECQVLGEELRGYLGEPGELLTPMEADRGSMGHDASWLNHSRNYRNQAVISPFEVRPQYRTA